MFRAAKALNISSSTMKSIDGDDNSSQAEHPRPSLRIRQQVMRASRSQSQSQSTTTMSSTYSDLKSMANESLRYSRNCHQLIVLSTYLIEFQM
jgi:hypothetical protein